MSDAVVNLVYVFCVLVSVNSVFYLLGLYFDLYW